MNYLLLKTVHQTAVVCSITGFFVRGAASLAGGAWVQARWAKTSAELIDTVLLLSAVALAWMALLNPIRTPWLLAKILALVVYVAFGVVALRPGLPRPLRVAAWLAALATVGYIVSVAITKTPLGWLSQF